MERLRWGSDASHLASSWLSGRDAVREVNKGHCVENLHFLGDGLWQAEKLD